jgi:cytochrome c oxidase cbb3-type subunit 3
MSSGWEWFIFLGTVLSMIGCVWLIVFTNRQRASDEEIAESESHVWDGDVSELNNPLPMWWLWLFIITLVGSAAYFAYYPGLAIFEGYGKWTQTSQYDAEVAAAEAKYGPMFAKFGAMEVSDIVKDEKALSIGSSLFANYCSQCHGSTAQGARGFPNLTDQNWTWGGDPAVIEATIMNGRTGTMPALGAALGGDVDAMVAYVQGLPDGQDTASPAHAKYMMFCIACHGPEGKGNPVLGAPDLTSDVWLYGSSQTEIKRTLMEGRQGVMPGHSSLIGPDRARILAAYVYSLSAE